MMLSPRLSLLLLLLALLGVGGSSGLTLRKRANLRALHQDEPGHEAFQNPDIIKKYDGVEAVAEALFTIACRAKHKSDVAGEAKAMAKDRGWKMDRMMEYVEEIQTAQVADLKHSCAELTGSSSNRCLKGCTARWASGGSMSLPEKKQDCINMCNIKHKNWEEECYEQVENLKNVYKVERGQLTGASHCVEKHCPSFPQVLMIPEPPDQQSVVDAGCDKRCGEDKQKCLDDCQHSCQLEDLDNCRSRLANAAKGVTAGFCEDFWQWIYDSEQVDPATGDPIPRELA